MICSSAVQNKAIQRIIVVNINSDLTQSQDIKFCIRYISDGSTKYYPDEDNTFTLPASADNITIYSSALTYSMHDPQIQYYLKGSDDEAFTVNKSAMQPVRYTNLSGGTYEFDLSLLDGSSHTIRQTVSFKIEKERSFHEHWYFFALCGVAALLLMAFIIWFFLRSKNKKLRKQEEQQKKIKRIAKEISYINVPAGDIPNVQVDGYRTASSKGIEISDGMKLTFHAKSLPTARLVWHCPYVDIFTADDGKVNGANYLDLAFMRIDGECWQSDGVFSVDHISNKKDDFCGWDNWKMLNKESLDCTVTFEKKDNIVTVITENAGIFIRAKIEVFDLGDKPVYAALTGDQCAITNIRIIKSPE